MKDFCLDMQFGSAYSSCYFGLTSKYLMIPHFSDIPWLASCKYVILCIPSHYTVALPNLYVWCFVQSIIQNAFVYGMLDGGPGQ